MVRAFAVAAIFAAIASVTAHESVMVAQRRSLALTDGVIAQVKALLCTVGDDGKPLVSVEVAAKIAKLLGVDLDLNILKRGEQLTPSEQQLVKDAIYNSPLISADLKVVVGHLLGLDLSVLVGRGEHLVEADVLAQVAHLLGLEVDAKVAKRHEAGHLVEADALVQVAHLIGAKVDATVGKRDNLVDADVELEVLHRRDVLSLAQQDALSSALKASPLISVELYVKICHILGITAHIDVAKRELVDVDVVANVLSKEGEVARRHLQQQRRSLSKRTKRSRMAERGDLLATVQGLLGAVGTTLDPVVAKVDALLGDALRLDVADLEKDLGGLLGEVLTIVKGLLAEVKGLTGSGDAECDDATAQAVTEVLKTVATLVANVERVAVDLPIVGQIAAPIFNEINPLLAQVLITLDGLLGGLLKLVGGLLGGLVLPLVGNVLHILNLDSLLGGLLGGLL